MANKCYRCGASFSAVDVGSAQKMCNTCVSNKNETAAFAKCLYCRDSCQLSSTTCDRCQKNESKYGKPSVCQYCQLPAAFLGKICQLCSNNEKRYGSPQHCHHCKLKAAFHKHVDQKDKKLLCRLCKSTYTRSLAVAEKLKVKRKLQPVDEGSSTTQAKRLSLSTSSGTSSVRQISNDPFGDHMLIVAQLKDETQALKRQIQTKDQTIFEKDKKIADLKAQVLCLDKEHRSRINQVQKQHKDDINQLQEKIRTLTRQIATISKDNRATTKKVDAK